jgi:hypothetical protein
MFGDSDRAHKTTTGCAGHGSKTGSRNEQTIVYSALRLLKRSELGDEFLLSVTRKAHRELGIVSGPFGPQHDAGSIL